MKLSFKLQKQTLMMYSRDVLERYCPQVREVVALIPEDFSNIYLFLF
jgi:hypothetical protein